MPIAHLVCGFLGAGKTTFAESLTVAHSAVRFSLDQLYLQLFADEPTYHVDSDKMRRLILAVEPIWAQTLAVGTDVVLDFGFWNRALRDATRAKASSVGAQSRLYWLQCADDVALARCLQRNGQPDSFLFSPEGFRELKSHFQCPRPDEEAHIISTEPSQPHPAQ